MRSRRGRARRARGARPPRTCYVPALGWCPPGCPLPAARCSPADDQRRPDHCAASAGKSSSSIREAMEVVDTHIHLTCRAGVGGPSLANSWLGEPRSQPGYYATKDDWTEDDLRGVMAAASPGGFDVRQAVFIQCFNEPPVEEARWILDLMSAEGSAVCGLVAHIPVPDGGAAVTEFLDSLRDDGGALPAGLKGGRVAFANEVTAPQFLDGLKCLGAAGLSWDFCVNAGDVGAVTEAAKQVPDMTLILDHFGHGGSVDSDYPRETWHSDMAALAAACPNVYVKVGSMFSSADEAASYFDDAIALFGYERLLAESNWFVGSSDESSYHYVYTLLMEACDRAGASDAEKAMVFHGNARRAYRLHATAGNAGAAKL